MRFTPAHWTAALALSAALHALGTAVMSEREPAAEVERGAGDPVLVASDLSANVSTVSSDATTEATEPVAEVEEAEEVKQETLKPERVEAETPEPARDAAEEPVEPEAVAAREPAEPAETVPDVERSPIEPRATAAPVPANPAKDVPDTTATSELNVEAANTVRPDLAAAPKAKEVDQNADPKPLIATRPEEIAPEVNKLLAVPLPKPKPPVPPRKKVAEPVKKKPVNKVRQPKRKAKTKPARKRQTSGSNKQAQPNRKPGDRGRNKTATGKANISNYMGRVASRLQRQKRYPRAAKRKKIQGTVVVSFTIRRNGSVAGVRIARRSGHAMLDSEVMAMVRRASPFPPIPTNAGRNTITVTVPISFRSR